MGLTLTDEMQTKDLANKADLGRYRGKKIAVGLSGGVDSAVSAYLLLQAGAEVKGVFMKNWAGEAGLEGSCPWEQDLESAQEVALFLGIEFESVNFEKEYKQFVLDNFFSEYEAGRTPNPDILCNSEIKFKAFLDQALEEGFDYVSTGHYARVEYLTLKLALDINSSPTSRNRAVEISGYFLGRPADSIKDQTYFLSGLKQSQLAKAVFPLANFSKSQVRYIANAARLPNANRPDSQGICFVGNIDVRAFLAKHLNPKKGKIIDIDSGRQVGEHEGMFLYTIGQREGLGLGGFLEPYYVVSKSSEKNIVYVGAGREHPLLNKSEVRFKSLELQHPGLTKLDSRQLNSLELSAAVRYRQTPAKGKLSQDLHKFEFENKQWAIAPGQSIVFVTSNGVTIGRALIN